VVPALAWYLVFNNLFPVINCVFSH